MGFSIFLCLKKRITSEKVKDRMFFLESSKSYLNFREICVIYE